MVLHNGEHDLIARFDALAAERVGNKVDCLSRVAGEDDFFLARGVDESAYFFAGILLGLGRGVGEIMQSPMNIGVFGGVGVSHAIENGFRLLRRGGVIEVDERLAIYLKRQDRKVLPDARDVISTVGQRLMHVTPVISALRAMPQRRPSTCRAGPRARSLPRLRPRRPGSAGLPLRFAGCRAP